MEKRDLNHVTEQDIYPLISEEKIRERVEVLGEEITSDYATPGKYLVMICVLKGGIVFFSDLIRTVRRPIECDFIRISSYGRGTSSSGKVEITKDVELDLNNKDVLLVEDIVDTGLSLKFLREHLEGRFPQMRSLKICTLLKRENSTIPVDYCGFSIGNSFVVGHGLDYGERFRELSYIGEIRL